MTRPRSPALRAGQRLGDAGLASAEVIAARLRDFTDPTALGSARQQREAARMVSEKVSAAAEGTLAAAGAMAALPMRWMQLTARANALTPEGWMRLCADAAALWVDVGDAAMAPARAAVLGNRTRLRRRG